MPEPLNPIIADRTRPSLHAEMADALTAAVDLALSTPPAIHITAGFATRVAALASSQAQPALHPAGLPAHRYARIATLLSVAAILAVLFLLAPGTLTRNPARVLVFTWLLSAEAVLLAVILGPWNSLIPSRR